MCYQVFSIMIYKKHIWCDKMKLLMYLNNEIKELIINKTSITMGLKIINGYTCKAYTRTFKI